MSGGLVEWSDKATAADGGATRAATEDLLARTSVHAPRVANDPCSGLRATPARTTDRPLLRTPRCKRRLGGTADTAVPGALGYGRTRSGHCRGRTAHYWVSDAPRGHTPRIHGSVQQPVPPTMWARTASADASRISAAVMCPVADPGLASVLMLWPTSRLAEISSHSLMFPSPRSCKARPTSQPPLGCGSQSHANATTTTSCGDPPHPWPHG